MYVRSPESIHLITVSLQLLTNISPSLTSSPLGNHTVLYIIMDLAFLNAT